MGKRKGLARSFGHMEGAKTLRKALEYLTEIGVKYLTVYAFSTENWNRPQDEVSTLMKLFLKYIKSERKNMMKNKIRFFVSGRLNRFKGWFIDFYYCSTTKQIMENRQTPTICAGSLLQYGMPTCATKSAKT